LLRKSSITNQVILRMSDSGDQEVVQIAYNTGRALDKLKKFVADTPCLRLSGQYSWPEGGDKE